MNELQRQAYMEAMGVDCYMPRLQLPGAAVSQLCVLPEVPVSIVAEKTAQSEVSDAPADSTQLRAASSGASRAIQAMFDQPPNAEAPAQGSNASSIEEAADFIKSAATKKQTVPSFNLSILRGANIMLIDNAIPGHIDPNSYMQLLQNLLFALGMGKQQLSLDAFSWPMSHNSQIDQSKSAAIQTLEAFLNKRVEQDDIAYLVLMGETAIQYLDVELAAIEGLGKHARLPVQCVQIHSAGLMLDQPLLKAEAWEQLQPLYRVMNSL